MNKIRKLDAYIAGTFLGPFLLCFVTFIGLYVVIDFFTNIDKYFQAPSPFAVIRYYLLSIPPYLAMIVPVLVVVPGVITVIRLERANEICAMRSSGVSGRRICLPIIACTGIIMIFAYLNQEVLVPSIRNALLSEEAEHDEVVNFAYVIEQYGEQHVLISRLERDSRLTTLTNLTFNWETGGVAHERKAERAFSFDLKTWYLENVRQRNGDSSDWQDIPAQILESTAIDNVLRTYQQAPDPSKVPLIGQDQNLRFTPCHTESEPGQTIAIAGAFRADGFEREGLWPVASDVEIVYRYQTSKSQTGKKRLRIKKMVWLRDPTASGDTQGRWIAFDAERVGDIAPSTIRIPMETLPPGITVPFTRPPQEIRAGQFRQKSSMLTLAELADSAARFESSRYRHRCWVTIWNRLFYPLAGIVLVMLTLPFAFRGGRQTTLVGIGLAILMTILYMATNFLALDLANGKSFEWGWPPFIGGAVPTILFAAIAIWVFLRIDEV